MTSLTLILARVKEYFSFKKNLDTFIFHFLTKIVHSSAERSYFIKTIDIVSLQFSHQYPDKHVNRKYVLKLQLLDSWEKCYGYIEPVRKH